MWRQSDNGIIGVNGDCVFGNLSQLFGVLPEVEMMDSHREIDGIDFVETRRPED
jgi:hypothetical protein